MRLVPAVVSPTGYFGEDRQAPSDGARPPRVSGSCRPGNKTGRIFDPTHQRLIRNSAESNCTNVLRPAQNGAGVKPCHVSQFTNG